MPTRPRAHPRKRRNPPGRRSATTTASPSTGEIPGSPIVAFKGEGIVDASILRVSSVIVDSSRATEWIDSLKEARILRQVSETETIHYDHVGTPIVMKDRDFVSDCKLEFDPAQKKVSLKIHSVNDASAPQTSYIRGELLHSSFVLTSIEHGTKTRVVAEIHADPKGSVAKWIVNLFQRNGRTTRSPA